jgi:putative glycosyltransferase (TIGR04372 family)
LHLGNAAEEYFLNTALSYLKNQNMCCVQNFFFSAKTNKSLSLLKNSKVHYANSVIKFFFDFIFTVEYLVFYIIFKSILIFFHNTKFYDVSTDLIQIKYTGKKVYDYSNNFISQKVFSLITKNWFFFKKKDEKNYLKKKFQINFNKKIILIHNRTKSFYGDNSYRNLNAEVFRKTIDWLINHDYFVILMGDNKFKIKHSNFLNYYKSPKNKIDDILIIKHTDYVICSPSGPGEVAFIFNKKIILFCPDLGCLSLANKDSCHIIPKIFFKKRLIEDPVKFYLEKNFFPKRGIDSFKDIRIKKPTSLDILKIIKKNFIITKTRKDDYTNYAKKKIISYLHERKIFRYLFRAKLCKGYFISLNKF